MPREDSHSQNSSIFVPFLQFGPSFGIFFPFLFFLPNYPLKIPPIPQTSFAHLSFPIFPVPH